MSAPLNEASVNLRVGPQTGCPAAMMDQHSQCGSAPKPGVQQLWWTSTHNAGRPPNWLSSSYDGPALTMRGGPQTGESATMMDPWGGCRGNRQTDRPARRWINAASAGV